MTLVAWHLWAAVLPGADFSPVTSLLPFRASWDGGFTDLNVARRQGTGISLWAPSFTR
jgi:hypothetical protein